MRLLDGYAILRDAGATPSMGSVGDAYDNALAEALFASLAYRRRTEHRNQSDSQVGRC